MEHRYKVADELNTPAYGEPFYEAIRQYAASGALTQAEARNILKTLIDADEIRERFHKEIKDLLSQRLQARQPVEDVLAFFRYCCAIYTSEEEPLIRQYFFKMLEQVEAADAFGRVKREFVRRCPPYFQ